MRCASIKQRRSAAGRAGAEARWAAARAARAADPVRQTRVSEVTIRDSHRPMQVFRVVRESTNHAWSRGRVYINDHRIGHRAFGRTAIAKLIAEALS